MFTFHPFDDAIPSPNGAKGMCLLPALWRDEGLSAGSLSA
jgi:hypothetical protein